jgi:hypothetical protein
MAGLTEFYCGWNEPSHASQFKWLEYTFKGLDSLVWPVLMQAPIKHLTSLKSTIRDRSENQAIRKLGGKNQPMTDRVRNAGVNQTLTLIEVKINQSESLAGKTSQWLTVEPKINQSEGLAGKTSQWLTVFGMPASIKHRNENQAIRKLGGKTSQWLTVSGMPASIKKSTNQKAWRENTANDWPCLGCRRQSKNQPIRKLGGKNQPMTDRVWDAGVQPVEVGDDVSHVQEWPPVLQHLHTGD